MKLECVCVCSCTGLETGSVRVYMQQELLECTEQDWDVCVCVCVCVCTCKTGQVDTGWRAQEENTRKEKREA